MSITAQLVCRESRQFIWLGKPVRSVTGSVIYFHLGFREDPRIWENTLLVASLCKFFAQTQPAILEVLLDPEFNELAESDGPWLWIGNDAAEDVTFEEYLGDFHEETRPGTVELTRGLLARSTQGYLVCLHTRNRIRLGQPYRVDGKVQHFFIETHEKLSADVLRMQAILKFLAENTGHKMQVMLADGMNDLLADHPGGCEIGGAAPDDLSFDDYLADWPGR